MTTMLPARGVDSHGKGAPGKLVGAARTYPCGDSLAARKGIQPRVHPHGVVLGWLDAAQGTKGSKRLAKQHKVGSHVGRTVEVARGVDKNDLWGPTPRTDDL